MSATSQGGGAPPLVSIGLPVYNGGRYLAASLSSLCAQSFRDIEIIISDNASTDGSAELCRDFAARDLRVRYSRLPENIGGVANHNRVFELATGEFFMWASADDLWQPGYVERCVAELRRHADVVLVYAINGRIDDEGRPCEPIAPGPPLDGDDVRERFARLTDIYRAIEPFYGLARRAVLLRSARMKRHPGFDRILLAEIGLHGKLRQIPEPLYCRRIHGQQSIHAFPSLRSRYGWINPGRSQRFLWPHLEYARQFTAAALRSAPGPRARLGCLWHMLRWCRWHHRELWADLRGVDPA
ncbi:MAG: glycosyltransferase family 2 protein [Gammaproteobacteria bacterium]|nr:glycosyltransferase family 2 protein [Gammaproteobacteria bacterium]QOJ31057.1 MAG: glycosyltransferase family 2 protein [Gammaproteobacteria bacterium]